MRKHLVFILLLFIYAVNLFSQDIHFSQNDAIPLYLTPAAAGEDCEYRVFFNHRNQWASVTVPYVTFSAAADKSFGNVKFLGGHDAGAGIIVSNDKAGDGEFTTTRIDLLGAYKLDFNNNIFKHLSLGLSLAYSRSSIIFSKLHFGNQFNGDRYDPNIAPDESFENDAFGFVDFAIGAYGKLNVYGYPMNAGFSFNHINKPKQRFYGESDANLYSRFNFFLEPRVRLNESNTLFPSFYWYRQGKLTEYDLGLIWRYSLPSMVVSNVYLGGWMRLRDAIILKLGVDYTNATIAVSYDINISKLKIASGGRGGIELSLIYRFCKPPEPAKNTIKHYCPEFM